MKKVFNPLLRQHLAELWHFVINSPVIPYDPVYSSEFTSGNMKIMFSSLVSQVVGKMRCMFKDAPVHIYNITATIRLIIDIHRAKSFIRRGEKFTALVSITCFSI
jgi:hypothetical protein